MSDIAELEQSKRNAMELIARRDMVLKLAENREFKKLIREQYMVDEAARFVAQSADPVLGPAERADALAMAQAAGHLKRWLNTIIRMGDVAADSIGEIDDAIAEIRASGEDA